MKSVALAALLLFTALASGQVLERTLPLPGTLGPPSGTLSLAYNNRNRLMYIGGDASDSVLVVDADRCRSVERVAVGDGVRAMCYNPLANKLYCAYVRADTVAVIDGSSQLVLARIGVGHSARSFCCDSIDDKLYVGDWASGSVRVIDCRGDSVVRTIDCGRGGSVFAPNVMCFAASTRAVFCADSRDSSVVVIDCSADTVLTVISVGVEPLAFCHNPTNNRVYCLCGSDGILYGIDAATNRVVSTIQCACAGTLACDPARNVLFMPDDDSLVVVDCSADTILAKVELATEGAWFVAYNSADDKIYVAHEESG